MLFSPLFAIDWIAILAIGYYFIMALIFTPIGINLWLKKSKL